MQRNFCQPFLFQPCASLVTFNFKLICAAKDADKQLVKSLISQAFEKLFKPESFTNCMG